MTCGTILHKSFGVSEKVFKKAVQRIRSPNVPRFDLTLCPHSDEYWATVHLLCDGKYTVRKARSMPSCVLGGVLIALLEARCEFPVEDVQVIKGSGDYIPLESLLFDLGIPAI